MRRGDHGHGLRTSLAPRTRCGSGTPGTRTRAPRGRAPGASVLEAAGRQSDLPHVPATKEEGCRRSPSLPGPARPGGELGQLIEEPWPYGAGQHVVQKLGILRGLKRFIAAHSWHPCVASGCNVLRLSQKALFAHPLHSQGSAATATALRNHRIEP